MSQITETKLDASSRTEVSVDEDVLALRSPLVQVRRDEQGSWFFEGPGGSSDSTVRTVLGAVVNAWPHVAALGDLEPGRSAIWSWHDHGWTSEFECTCGECEQPAPVDLDRRSWPADLDPEALVSVEETALSGQVVLSDILYTSGRIALLGVGEQNRSSEEMTSVAMANVIRRWPHTMRALRSVRSGYLLRWNPESLNWHEYETV
ncbi:hypothetical protein [Actinopolyspora mortivallis]|uniref:hypothetical protein n=1 Tax=Actinopolyspora mortivallis TaxID=33906 RepID=UPI000371C428|nr:hypothetical protein [Actinopolyspora mortivallis]